MADVGQFKKLIGQSFYNFTPLRDASGFSVQKNYPDTIAYKPAKYQNGTPDNVVLIHMVFLKESQNNGLIPLLISARKYSKYLSDHFDYDFSDENSPTESSITQSKKTKQPINIESNNDYFFNEKTKEFENSFADVVSLNKILNDLFSDHINTARRFRGNVVRVKFVSQKIAIFAVNFIIKLLKKYLKLVNQLTFEPGDTMAGELEPYKREDMRIVKPDFFDFYGCRVPKNLIILLSCFVVVIFLSNPDFYLKSRISYGLKNYNFLFASFGVVILWVLDGLLPEIFFYLINIFILLKGKFLFAKWFLRPWPFYLIPKVINFRKLKKIWSFFSTGDRKENIP